MDPHSEVISSTERRGVVALLLVAATLVVAYWVAWFAHRSLVASETTVPYMQFEDAFPLADGWLVICLVASAFCLVTRRKAALLWLLAGGGAGLYLLGMDVLYDLQHGVWAKGDNGIVELVINGLTLFLSLFVLSWSWTRRDELLAPMSQFHFDPTTYLAMVKAEVPWYETLQETIAGATKAIKAESILDLGTGTGETLARVLPRHPGAHAVGIDESPAMLEAARSRLEKYGPVLQTSDLLDELPDGPFDLVVSALAVHHLDEAGKAQLFRRVAGVLRPGGRFVLGDVIVPEDPGDVVTPIDGYYDKPSTLADQVAWLEEAGLVVEVVWKESDIAVMTADRPS